MNKLIQSVKDFKIIPNNFKSSGAFDVIDVDDEKITAKLNLIDDSELIDYTTGSNVEVFGVNNVGLVYFETKILDLKENIITLSVDKGGYVCQNCYTNDKIVDTKTIKLIRMFYYVDISKITKLEVSNKVKEEINEFLDNYYDKYTGLYLKTKNLLKDLNRIG